MRASEPLPAPELTLREICLRIGLSLLFLAILSLASCGGGDSSDVSTLRKEVVELREEVEDFKKAAAKLDSEALARDMFLGLERFYERHAILDCSGGGFVPVKESGGRIEGKGYFLLACDEAVPYLNGHRLKLRIGNPQAATYNGITLTAQWGRALPEDGLWEMGWNGKELQGLSKKRFDLPDSIPPASWSTLQIVLTPSKAEDLSVIVISVETNSLILSR